MPVDDDRLRARVPASAALIEAAAPRVIPAPPVRTTPPVNFRVIAEGLRFPEGPVALSDGSVLVVEIEGGTLSRCTADGRVEIIARTGGGPNGAAIGPDGACYVANNGGFNWKRSPIGVLTPTADLSGYKGGSIQRVDLRTGEVSTLYEAVEGRRLSSPNDLVFDDKGGFWFTDWGKPHDRSVDKSGLYYAKADGSMIEEAAYPLQAANGVGLSPDGRTVYVSETRTARLLAGALDEHGRLAGGALRLVAGVGGNAHFDSLAVEADGSICVAVPVQGGVMRIAADGQSVEHTPLADNHTTNVAFGGADLRTCFVTLSGRGQLAAIDWPRPGLRLNYAV